jgi:hypothetical protein
LKLWGNLLNKHLAHRTFFPVGNVVKNHELCGLIQQSQYRRIRGDSGASGGQLEKCHLFSLLIN